MFRAAQLFVTPWKCTIRGSLNSCDAPTLAKALSIPTSRKPQQIEDELSEEKIERLAEIICQAGDEPAAALLVLMGTLENCAPPKVLANTTKHFAFQRCGEMNL